MSLFNTDFAYMPPGSFTILPDDTIYFWEERCSEEQKERMLREWPAYLERMQKKHGEEMRWDSSDMASGGKAPRENWEASAEHMEKFTFPWLTERHKHKEAVAK